MTYAVDIEQEIRYVLEDDRGLDDSDKGKPVFIFKAMSAPQVAEVDDSVLKATAGDAPKGKKKKLKKKRGKGGGGDVVAMHIGTSVLKILDAGLVRFENMHKPDGTPVEWDDDDREAMYSAIPTTARQELANEIRNRSDLSEEAVKNLGSGLDLS